MSEHKEEVVISGIGGVFPECDNLDELKDFLFSKSNAIKIDSRRWKPNELGVAAGTGKIKNVDAFDATFFRAHPKLVKVMDPVTRLFLERSVEAIIDAGLSPMDLHGTNTAVFSGHFVSDTEISINYMDYSSDAAFTMLGRSQAMQANRVSYILNLTGPSFSMDGGWLCGSYGLEKAKSMIENGITTSAIVGVTNLVLIPEMQLQYQGINRLNKSVHTKPFSFDADGYNRSDACVVFLLQRASEAKRSYGTLVNVKSIQFGDNQGHMTEHNGDNFKSLLLDSYKEANIDPASVEYIEAYGSGIKDEDSMELNIMEEVFCTKQRILPLKVGSVKSNLGHCEVAGLFVSIVKAIIALDSGYISPNINYMAPNENVKALINDKIQVVTEKIPLVGDVVGVNAFGFPNGFSHVILRRYNKVYNYNTNNKERNNCIPRLILASGRNEENVKEAIKKIMNNGNNAEYLALTNEVFTSSINFHFYRGFSIFPSTEVSQADEVWNVTPKKRPVWFIFSGMGSQWQEMGSSLMGLTVFANVIEKCDSILRPRGVDIKHILTSPDPKVFDNILNSFVGIAAIQIGLVDVLRLLDIIPDGIVGHSVGELGCAYSDGCFTAEEMILAAYARGRASLETKLIPGMMAAVGLGYHEIKTRLPQDIDVACRNSTTSCTISGPVNSINAFVLQLKSEGVFAKAVNVAGIAYHSRYIQTAGPILLKYLKEVIKEPKLRSSKWISSSLPESDWSLNLAKYSSPEYHTNNLLSSVLFEDALKHVPSDAIAIEIAPHGLLQAILKKALPETVINIPITSRTCEDPIRFLLSAIGKMYTSGLNVNIQKLYPVITYPVSRGTPAIQSVPFWDHNEQWISYLKISEMKAPPKVVNSTLLLNDSIHLTEHRIYNHHIIPLSYILINVWESFIKISLKTFSSESVRFDNLRFRNNVEIHPTKPSNVCLMIQRGTGIFEYNINGEVILSGQISFWQTKCLNSEIKNSISQMNTINKMSNDSREFVSKSEIYTVLKNIGYDLGDNFKNINNVEVSKRNINGYIEWKNDWIYFLDGLLKFPLLNNLSSNHLEAPVFIRQISIIPEIMHNSPKKDLYVKYNTLTKEIICTGIKILDLKISPIVISKFKPSKLNLEEQVFFLFHHLKCKNIRDFLYCCIDIILDSDQLNVGATPKNLVLCTPYHYNDPIFRECTKTLKQIVENQISTNSLTLNWEYVMKHPEDDESEIFVTTTNVDYLQDTTKAFAMKKNSYVIVCSNKNPQDHRNWKIIAQQKFKENSYLALMRKEIVTEENIILLQKANDNYYDSKVWTALEKYSLPEKMIYLIFKSEPSEGIMFHAKKMVTKYKSKKLRFLYILDSNAPDLETNKSFYTKHLSKGFIVNIYKNGGWGFYKKIVLQDLNNDIKSIKIPALLKNISTNRKLTLKYLGLNFKDLVVDDSTENEFGPLEYSGVDENDKNAMGISFFSQTSSQINLDSLLSWPVPINWTLEDASTVSLSYAISYYIFNVLSHQNNIVQSILVTSGLNPIGQAAISIGLSKKFDMYAIVDSITEADKLSNTHPELSRSKILVNKNEKFDVQLGMMTKSRGMNIVLNFLSGNAFLAALRTLGNNGEFYNFSKTDMKNQLNIGLRKFLYGSSFTVVSSSMLLNENVHNKRIVQQAFMDGLNNGVVKPCHRYLIKAPYSEHMIFDTMRMSSAFTKVVVPLNVNVGVPNKQETLKYSTFQCNPNQVYIIVANKTDWLDLAEWLVDRGAKIIVIAVKRCFMSSAISGRFDKLIYRDVSIQIESRRHLKTKEESVKWLNRLTSSSTMGIIFVINQMNNSKINNLCYGFEENSNKTKTTSFICILSQAGNVCNELKSIGYNALNISWDGISSQYNKIPKILISMDMLLQNSNTLNTHSFVCSEPDLDYSKCFSQANRVKSNFIPESVDELLLLNEKITKVAKFIEIPTRSPRFSQSKSVTPVFIIPGFKPKIMETLYKQFHYPIFEAQLPEYISSIDELSTVLVNSLKIIITQGYVSLIGESWGGIVALKMAQILEAQGTLVTVSLLEGDPEILTSWAKSFQYNNTFSSEFHTMFSSLSSERLVEDNIQRALNWIRNSLQVLLDFKPFPNKLLTKVFIFKFERPSDFHTINLNDYCVNPPVVHIISKTNYKDMMMDNEMIKIIAKNVVHLNPRGIDISLTEKYKLFYYSYEKLTAQ